MVKEVMEKPGGACDEAFIFATLPGNTPELALQKLSGIRTHTWQHANLFMVECVPHLITHRSAFNMTVYADMARRFVRAKLSKPQHHRSGVSFGTRSTNFIVSLLTDLVVEHSPRPSPSMKRFYYSFLARARQAHPSYRCGRRTWE